MSDNIQDQIAALVHQRLREAAPQIAHSLRQIAAGNPLGAEPDEQRRVDRISAKSGMSHRDSEVVSTLIEQTAKAVDLAGAESGGAERGGPESGGPEAQQGPTIDFVGVEFLTRGRLAANAVGRVISRSGRGIGTGFLVGPGLFLTNNHVIGGPEAAQELRAEFDYEADDSGVERPVTRFVFDPAACFVTDPMQALDFTLIAIGERVSGGKEIATFGFLPLSDAADKHMLGEIANIIQHPTGQLKQIVVRENNLVARDETRQVLHYLADTERGSSGSPVCNNDWEPIALHHWGGPALEVTTPDGTPLRRDINEGVRISAIVRALRDRAAALGARPAARVASLLKLWADMPRRGPSGPERAPRETAAPGSPHLAAPRRNADGSMTWMLPFEVTLGTPGRGAEAARARAAGPGFADRGGYEPGFIPGFVLPIPRPRDADYPLARNRQALPDEDPHELRYHHFSILMNAERRLAAITACNIDGSRLVAVNRSDKSTNTAPTLSDLGAESRTPEGGTPEAGGPEAGGPEAGGPEASDDFTRDPRLPDHEQMGREFYQDQRVPGFDKPEFPGRNASAAVKRAYARAMSERTARMFQKGHIILRGDPAWGLAEEALAAEEDTFFYTNAAPQLGYFNQGSPIGSPGAKGKLRWRAVETYVLRNAFAQRQRVTVFAGPVFDADYDVAYREGVLVPMRFWKVAAWAEGGNLRAIALLADQKPVLEQLTQGVPEAAEGFEDEAERARVGEFLTTVRAIETLTGLDFGAALRRADVRQGARGRISALDAPDDLLGLPSKPAVKPRRRTASRNPRKPG